MAGWLTHERGRDYLRALLVQGPDQRNAGNLSEAVGVSARSMQRFLTEAHWDDDGVMGRLQEYLGSRLEHPETVVKSCPITWSTGFDEPKANEPAL